MMWMQMMQKFSGGGKMNKWSFEEQKEEIKSIIKQCMVSKHLIPVLGSGFSAGTTTLKGSIPNVKSLTNQLVSYMEMSDTWKGRNISEFQTLDLFQVATSFWRDVEKNSKIKTQFS
jgi:hypothetical protein